MRDSIENIKATSPANTSQTIAVTESKKILQTKQENKKLKSPNHTDGWYMVALDRKISGRIGQDGR